MIAAARPIHSQDISQSPRTTTARRDRAASWTTQSRVNHRLSYNLNTSAQATEVADNRSWGGESSVPVRLPEKVALGMADVSFDPSLQAFMISQTAANALDERLGRTDAAMPLPVAVPTPSPSQIRTTEALSKINDIFWTWLLRSAMSSWLIQIASAQMKRDRSSYRSLCRADRRLRLTGVACPLHTIVGVSDFGALKNPNPCLSASSCHV